MKVENKNRAKDLIKRLEGLEEMRNRWVGIQPTRITLSEFNNTPKTFVRTDQNDDPAINSMPEYIGIMAKTMILHEYDVLIAATKAEIEDL